MHFAITIDTEVDKQPDWRVSDPVTWEGIHTGVFELLQPIFDRHNVAPVYFLSNEVLHNDETATRFAPLHAQGRAELATHLHYEFAGPLAVPDITGQRLKAIQCELEKDQERAALTYLTNLFIERYGFQPVSFRAGKFGIGRNTLPILAELGYEVDSSVTPGICWNYDGDTMGRQVDFTQAPRSPYFADPTRPEARGEGPMLEIPLTIAKSHISPKELARLVLGKPRKHIWFKPYYSTNREMYQQIKWHAKHDNPDTILVMFFHNMHVIAGKSPHCLHEHQVQPYLDQIEYFITTAKSFGATPITFADYNQQFRARHTA